MKGQQAPSADVLRRHRELLCIVLAGCATMVAGGCGAERKRPAIPWATAVRVRPVVPARPAASTTDGAEPVPELRIEAPQQAIRLGTAKAPARPHVAAPSTQGNDSGAGKAEQPLIAPQLPQAEAHALQEQVNQSVGIAERNLAVTKGKSLNAVQLDLYSKVRSFLTDAREAARAGDLRRASNLAKKAQVLSEELAGPL